MKENANAIFKQDITTIDPEVISQDEEDCLDNEDASMLKLRKDMSNKQSTSRHTSNAKS